LYYHWIGAKMSAVNGERLNYSKLVVK